MRRSNYDTERVWILPLQQKFKTSDIDIEPYSDLQLRIENVLETNRVHDGWFYPPIVQPTTTKNSLIAPLKPAVTPEIPTTRFELPTTHTFIHKTSADEKQVDFLIVSLGLLLGMRLIPKPWGHFYKTPVEEHKLSDLIVGAWDVESSLPLVDRFYRDATPEQRSVVWSAINSFQMAQSYNHSFEEFLLQYITLDTVYQAFRMNSLVPRVRHGERPKAICEHLGIALPAWAIPDSSGNSEISNVRNNLFHEGAINGGPIGYDVIRPTDMLVHMQALNMRSILLLIGVDEPYVHTPVTSMQMHGLR